MKRFFCAIFCVFVLICAVAYAHPGRLDANGGHWNHKTGEYHYHTGENVGKRKPSSSTTNKTKAFFKSPNTPTKNKTANSDNISVSVLLCIVYGISVLLAFCLYFFNRK